MYSCKGTGSRISLSPGEDPAVIRLENLHSGTYSQSERTDSLLEVRKDKVGMNQFQRSSCSTRQYIVSRFHQPTFHSLGSKT